MARDLEEIYWLWDNLGLTEKPNLVIAIQKEMFRDHFFLDKMWNVELEPLKAEQVVEVYVRPVQDHATIHRGRSAYARKNESGDLPTLPTVHLVNPEFMGK